MPTSTVEDYLKHIFLEERRGGNALVPTGQVASALGVSPASATAMVKTLADAGLLSYEPYSGVRLTEAGRKLAVHVVRRHRLLELFLVNILGMSWTEVHPDAERLEHAISDQVLERIDAILGQPVFDPHGDPIPDDAGRIHERPAVSLLDCPLEVGLRVAQVTNQSREFLNLLGRHGMMPGSVVTVLARHQEADSLVVRTASGDRVGLGFRAAAQVLVELPEKR